MQSVFKLPNKSPHRPQSFSSEQSCCQVTAAFTSRGRGRGAREALVLSASTRAVCLSFRYSNEKAKKAGNEGTRWATSPNQCKGRGK